MRCLDPLEQYGCRGQRDDLESLVQGSGLKVVIEMSDVGGTFFYWNDKIEENRIMTIKNVVTSVKKNILRGKESWRSNN